MRTFIGLTKVSAVGLAIVVLFAIEGQAYGKGKPGGDDECPRDIMCPAVWDPVICDDGNIYSNACYAFAACATGCEPLDGGPIPAAGPQGRGKPGGDDECPRDIMCPAVWDPVICDDGNVYSNACYAFAACATGCEPLDGGPIPAAGPQGRGKPGGDDECPRDIMCPAVWDPVICDDGKVYSNACYAFAACATGCEPLDGGPIPVP